MPTYSNIFSVFTLFRYVAAYSWTYSWFLLHFTYAIFWFYCFKILSLSLFVQIASLRYTLWPSTPHHGFSICLPLSPSSNSIWRLFIFFPLHTNLFVVQINNSFLYYHHMLIIKIMNLIVTFSYKNMTYYIL